MVKEQKIYKLLAVFSKRRNENSFGLFVSSPYFNNLNNVTKLFDIIRKYHPEFKPSLSIQ
jgi:hypothetical protein